MELLSILIGILGGILFKYLIDRTLNRRAIARRRQRGGYIYFYMNPASCLPAIKIGRASKATRRLKQQRTPLPFGMKVAGVLMVKSDVFAESFIHRKFAYQRISSQNEWFYLSPSIIWYILTVRDMGLTRKVRHDLSHSSRR